MPEELSQGDYEASWSVTAPKGGESCAMTAEAKQLGGREHEIFAIVVLLEGEHEDGQKLLELDGGRYAFGVESDCEWSILIRML
jgi:hypothetical protein